MPYVIGGACVDVMDKACTEECPVDCIYVGDRKLYIQPRECIDCGACEPVCPVEAIAQDRMLEPEDEQHIDDGEKFFYQVLPGRDEPLGSPGGTHKTGDIGVDTPLVAGLPANG